VIATTDGRRYETVGLRGTYISIGFTASYLAYKA